MDTSTPTGRAGRTARASALLLAAVLGACGGSEAVPVPASPGSDPASTAPAATAAPTTTAKGSPRWETVTTLTGTGSAEPPAFPIMADSIQWRVRWECQVGQLRITTDPPPRRGAALVEGSCPGTGEGFAIVTGDVRLKVEAAGPWNVIVDQQVDTPLNEPPFEGMATAPVLRQGAFYPVEKEARGTARLFRRADGANVLRLDDFEVTNNVDLFIWLSEAAMPRTSAEAVAAPYVVLGNLRSTLGSQSYVLPADLPVERVGSVIVWCAPVRIAYGAAGLVPLIGATSAARQRGGT